MSAKEEYKDFYVAMGKFFKMKRSATNFSIQDIADTFGHSKGWYGDIERGRGRLNVEDCMKICGLLHTDLGEMESFVKGYLESKKST